MKNLFKALAAFQSDVPVIHKGTEGYGYSYAGLPEIIEIITPLLEKHGLAFTQPFVENGIKTILFHVDSGEVIESVMAFDEGVELKGMNRFQVRGSEITYKRRYMLSSILGLVTDKDTDGAGEQKKTTVKQSTTEPTKPVFDDKELAKEVNKNAIQQYINGGFSAKEIREKLEQKYSSVAVETYLTISSMKPNNVKAAK